MIVRKNLKFSKIIQVSWKSLLSYAIIGASAFLLYDHFEFKQFTIPFAVVGTLGTALAIILGFRNSASYDRWWESRKIWGGIVNTSRTLGRQVTTLISDNFKDDTVHEVKMSQIQKTLIYRHIAWINALRLQLRKQDKWEELKSYISEKEYKWLLDRKNKATQIVQLQAEELRKLRDEHYMEDFRFIQFDNTLTELYNLQGKAERIKNTPLPRQYDYFPKIFMSLFILLLPFGLIETLSDQGISWLVIPLTMAVGYVFLVIRKIGELNEDPFENKITDTPISALCRTIEIDLREMLKETELPESLKPIDGYLF